MNNFSILMINASYIKQHSNVMNNIQDNYLNNNVIEAQNLYIQNTLGTNMYDKIVNNLQDYKDDYESGLTGKTLSDYFDSYYVTLIDEYIKPSLLYYTLYESVNDLYIKINNKSISKQSGDYSTPVSSKMATEIKQDYLNKAEFYNKRIINYIKNNYSNFSEYYENDGSFGISPDKNYKAGGWYLK